MTKPGHEAPLYDNRNPADLTSHAPEEQLRVGQTLPEPEAPPVDVAAEVLTPAEQEEVERYVGSDTVSPQEALQRRVPRSKANRIFGAQEARKIADSAGRIAEERREAEKIEEPPMEVKVKIMRDSYPDEQPPQAA